MRRVVGVRAARGREGQGQSGDLRWGAAVYRAAALCDAWCVACFAVACSLLAMVVRNASVSFVGTKTCRGRRENGTSRGKNGRKAGKGDRSGRPGDNWRQSKDP